MPDLETRVEAWRRQLLCNGVLRAWQVDELEDHLRSAYARALEQGEDDRNAWSTALNHTGQVELITAEFKKEQAMNPVSRFAGIALVLAMIGLILGTGPGGFQMYVHVPSFVALFVFVFGGLVASFGLDQVRRALRASLTSSTPLEPEEAAVLSGVLSRGQRLSWMSGVVLVIIGFIQMMGNLSDPSMIGQGVATASLSLLYGAVLAEVGFASVRQWLENRGAAMSVVSAE